MFGVFRVKNHEFTQKNHIFSNCGGRRTFCWGISCEKSRFYAKKIIFFPIPPLDPPLTCKFQSHFTSVVGLALKVNKSRPVQKNLFILLLANAFDIETNPGPIFPCGACTKAVTWKHKAICCDSCDALFHINCQGIHSNAYRFLDASNISWECIQCGMPIFSTSLFNSTYSIELENQYSNLSNCSELSSPGWPKATSSPNKETKLKSDKS